VVDPNGPGKLGCHFFFPPNFPPEEYPPPSLSSCPISFLHHGLRFLYLLSSVRPTFGDGLVPTSPDLLLLLKLLFSSQTSDPGAVLRWRASKSSGPDLILIGLYCQISVYDLFFVAQLHLPARFLGQFVPPMSPFPQRTYFLQVMISPLSLGRRLDVTCLTVELCFFFGTPVPKEFSL